MYDLTKELDNKVISAPVIRSPILGGSGQIEGGFSVEEANNLAILLRAGALPAPLEILEEKTIGPGLGEDSIKSGQLATIVGLTGVLVQLLMVGVFLNLLKFSFFYSQIFAVIAAMTSNFFLNNMLTYRDQALSGKRIFLGLVSFYFVCSIGAIANVAVANLAYSFVSLWILASFLGSVMSSLWNFMSSKWLTWRIR